jgi:hypothetical protein
MTFEQKLKILETVADFALPLVLLLVGILISKKVESIKHDAAKQKEWEMRWADRFF